MAGCGTKEIRLMGTTGGPGAEPGAFIKYQKTTHLFGSKLADQDKMLTERETRDLLKKNNLNFVWESKLDGTNTGISFVADGKLQAQNRGRFLSSGEHQQYQIFLAWASTYSGRLEKVLGRRFILFGEWVYALHTVLYRTLPHYMNEFDIWDRERGIFLSTPKRNEMLAGLVADNVLAQVPVVYPRADAKNWLEKSGKLTLEEARNLMLSHGPMYGEEKPEGLYLKVEKGDEVVARYKLVRDEFIQKIINDNVHWRSRPVTVQGLAPGVDIFAAKTE